MISEPDIQRTIDGLTLRQKIGQMFMGNICGGESLDVARRNFELFHFGGLQYSGVFETFVRGGHYRPCGVCRNQPLDRVAAFLHDIKRAGLEITGLPVILGGDQEGGIGDSIIRRRNVTLVPKQMGLGAIGTAEAAALAAEVTAAEMKILGLDMLYGPCLDVNTNPANPEIGARSFSEDPHLAAELGAATIRGYRRHDIIATAKHFPGRGHGASNAHHELEVIDLDRARLEAVELLPFKRAVAAGADAVMLAHTRFPALEPEPLPASLSPRIIGDVLRGELGFEGIVLPDTLTMFAISKNFEVPRACAMCLEAGADMIFMKVQDLYAPAIEAIEASVKAGRLTEDRINQSLTRILTLKARRGLFEVPPTPTADGLADLLDSPAHVAAGRDLARGAMLVLKDDANLLPVTSAARKTALVVVPRDAHVILANDPVMNHDMLRRSLTPVFGVVEEVLTEERPDELQGFEAAARAKNADLVVFGIFSAGASDEQIDLLKTLVEMDRRVVVLVTGSPYVANRLPAGVDAVVCGFGISPAMFDAFAELVAGTLRPTASLPVTM